MQLYSIGILGLMLFRVARDGKDDADKEPQAGNPVFFDPVMDKVLGDGLYNFSATTVINVSIRSPHFTRIVIMVCVKDY